MGKYKLDADVAAFIERSNAAFDDGSASMSAAEQRRRYGELCKTFDVPRPIGLTVQDDMVVGDGGPIRIRIYRPESSQKLGCLVYFHGGGWVVGNLDSHDAIAAEIAHRAHVVVVAVDYRLAPEHRYPKAHEDCWRALCTVEASPESFGVDRDRIAIGGDSAGANIAAGLAVRARDRGDLMIAGQVLIYGAFGGSEDMASYTECSDAPMLSTSDMHAYHMMYFGSEQTPKEPLAGALNALDMDGLPPAFIQAAEYDPLRDDSIEYARRLGEAGVPVELHVEAGLVHGFLRSRHVTIKGAAAFARICDATKRMLNG
ncbi:MAG: alpha/beta hydrolase [Rhodospirillales bacterium]|nr:alpha/beta hydrolase [Rhodospirillales bacterium]